MSPAANQPLALTVGEPAGIGPELCLALAGSSLAEHVVLIGDPELLTSRATTVGIDVSLSLTDRSGRTDKALPENGLRVLPQNLPNPNALGTPDPQNAQSLLDGLTLAVNGCLHSRFAGLVTAPLQKSVINDAGIPFTGHTEFLAELCNAELPVMLLVGGNLRVALASTHLPLAAVPAYLTRDRIAAVIRVLHADLIRRFHIDDPEILVLGLNPHAGEAGHLGTEERETITPLLEDLQAEGLRLRGPLPADTAFTAAGGRADAVLAMYHDQGLPVLKYASFGHAVNVTLGLPIVRTSVDHGTALDIAGQGKADPGSLRAAVELALEMSGA
ncbi:MAG: 4-hydroxythreonine-4-phosphate dehydrogenase PdxA [Pseudomonadota bacterium]